MYFPEELWGIIKSFAYIFNKDAIEYQRQFRMSLNRTFTCPLLTFDLWQVNDTLMAYTYYTLGHGAVHVLKCIRCDNIYLISCEMGKELDLQIKNPNAWNNGKPIGYDIDIHTFCNCP